MALASLPEGPLVSRSVEEVAELSEEPRRRRSKSCDDDLEFSTRPSIRCWRPRRRVRDVGRHPPLRHLSVVADEAPLEAPQETLDLLDDPHVRSATDRSAPDDSTCSTPGGSPAMAEGAVSALSADDEVRSHLEGRLAD